MNEIATINNISLLNYLMQNVKPNWLKMWDEIFKLEEGKETLNFLKSKLEKHGNTFYFLPKIDSILNAFKSFDLNETKLVLLGQDPYINTEVISGEEIAQAMGLSFSVPDNIKVPPSLKNIFKEIKNCYPNFNIPNHGNLTRWVKEEKILLLNSALTVKKGISNSHQKKWEKLTDKVIKHISDKSIGVIFLLLGNNAKNKEKLIDGEKHYIIKGVHPSPLSANRGFFGSNIFSNINSILIENNKKEINWEL